MSTCSGCPTSVCGSADRAFRLLSLISGPSTCRTQLEHLRAARSRGGTPLPCRPGWPAGAHVPLCGTRCRRDRLPRRTASNPAAQLAEQPVAHEMFEENVALLVQLLLFSAGHGRSLHNWDSEARGSGARGSGARRLGALGAGGAGARGLGARGLGARARGLGARRLGARGSGLGDPRRHARTRRLSNSTSREIWPRVSIRAPSSRIGSFSSSIFPSSSFISRLRASISLSISCCSFSVLERLASSGTAQEVK